MLWFKKPKMFLKYFHLIFPVPESLYHKRKEVLSYLIHLLRIRNYVYNNPKYLVYLLEKSISNLDLSKYDKVKLVGKDTAANILSLHSKMFPRIKASYFLINPMYSYNIKDKFIYKSKSYIWNAHKDRFIDTESENICIELFEEFINY